MAEARTGTEADTVREVARLADELLAQCDEHQAGLVRSRLDDQDLREWTYLPGDRAGLSMEDMTAAQRDIASAVLDRLAGEGATPRGAVEAERVRRRFVTGSDEIGPDRYWFRVIGEPGPAPWGLRVNGHHLAVHLVAVGDRFTVTPHFLGSEPAVAPIGPRAGYRLLGPDEDMARSLLDLLEPDQLAAAVVAPTAPSDILTRADPVVDPSVLPRGLSHGDMNLEQQAGLAALVQRYLGRAPAAYARACWQQVLDAGVDRLSFAWAGPRAPGEKHYYCVTGPTLVLEYDNTQDDGNHAHSVWRHLRDDWGEDLLRGHYREHHF